MLRKATLVSVLILARMVFAQPPPVVGGGTLSLEELARSGVLLTVIIKDRNAADRNLRLLDAGPNYIEVQTESGGHYTYLFESIKEIRVQEGQEIVKRWRPPKELALPPSHQQVVDRAIQRAQELFLSGEADPTLKLDAAVLLVIGGQPDQQEAALQYVQQLHGSPGLAIALFAAYRSYLAGKGDVINRETLEQALTSGNLEFRSHGATLAGLLRYEPAESYLMTMLQDRREEVAVPAVYALARLGNREIIPTLFAMVSDLDMAKGEAAVFALERLADAKTTEELRLLLPASEGMTRYRLARLLHALGEPQTMHTLREEVLDVPTLRVYVALILAGEGDPKAMAILRERLSRRYDEVERSLLLRAYMAAALVEGGDRTAVPILQELLRKESPVVQERVCQLIATIGAPQLTPILQPAIENQDARVALAACQAALAIASPELGQRFRELWLPEQWPAELWVLIGST